MAFNNLTADIGACDAGEAFGEANTILSAPNNQGVVGRFVKMSNGKLVPITSKDDAWAGVLLRSITDPVDGALQEYPITDYLVEGNASVEALPVATLPAVGAKVFMTPDGRVAEAADTGPANTEINATFIREIRTNVWFLKVG